MVALCEDPAVMGAPFYVMQHVEGAVLRRTAQSAALTDAQRADIAHRLIDTLADLHEIDPAAVGLEDFGHPEGFLERQVRRWSAQLERSLTREVPGFPSWPPDSPPTSRGPSAPASSTATTASTTSSSAPDQRIRAVLDWEMATLGDPLCDLGLLPVYASPADGVAGIVSDGMGSHNGFPPIEALIERYAPAPASTSARSPGTSRWATTSSR